jgi:hypothetical protein
MRHPILPVPVLLILSTASLALAGAPISPLRPLVASDLPAACRNIALEPTSARISGPDFGTHISVANCLAEASMSKLALQPNAASIAALDAAAGPSLAILDDVIQNGDAGWKHVAEAAKADLFMGMVVRMRSVANDPGDHLRIERGLVAWLHGATQASREATQTAVR